jgi:membrane protease YdiL (CAAX protease family)
MQGSPVRYVLLVFALTLPFWGVGAVTGTQLLPSVALAGPAFVCSALAAAILVYREDKGVGVRALLKRSFDVTRTKAKGWYAPTLPLMPAVMRLAFAALRLFGVPVAAPVIAVVPTLLLAIGFFVGALDEELGWSGYAIDPLEERWSALVANIFLGGIWSVWHYVGSAEAHRAVAWIAWWSLGTLALHVLIVWLYNNTGQSVSAAALFHLMSNLTWQLFPNGGSYDDPRITGVIRAVVAVITVVVWGPRTLTRAPLKSSGAPTLGSALPG